jgi:hypothetical protein
MQNITKWLSYTRKGRGWAIYNFIFSSVFVFLFAMPALTRAQTIIASYSHFKLICREEINGTMRLWLQDTATNKEKQLDIPPNSCSVHFSDAGFIFIRAADKQQWLADTNAKILVKSAEVINIEGSYVAAANFMNDGGWAFINLKGDTLAWGKPEDRMKDYIPSLSNQLNPEYGYNKKTRRMAFGYLNQQANWQIAPEYEEVTPFDNGGAKVKINGKWGAVDISGYMFMKPDHENRNFIMK